MKYLINHHKNPENFHRQLLYKSYFEGWYYKQVSKDMKNTISFIPGVSFSNGRYKSFIQIIHLDESGKLTTYNIDYKISDFRYAYNPFSIWIRNSNFTMERAKVNIKSKELSVCGTIYFRNKTYIQTNILHPNIMGIFSYIPFMQCNHGVLSMSHRLEGEIYINDKKIDFTGGKGYIEKDWGRSFPKKYIWIQSNHFCDDSVSFFFSIAHIPFVITEFTGFICNIIYDNKEYRFATYNGSRVVVNKCTQGKIYIVIVNSKYILHIKAKINKSSRLMAPHMGGMDNSIKEGLGGMVSICLKHRSGNIVLKDKSLNAGIEIVDI